MSDSWDHVTDDQVREYLIHGSMDSDTHADVLARTQQAMKEDLYNHLVLEQNLGEVALDARIEACREADHAFNQEGDLESTHGYITQFWSI